ncbi:MAG: MmcQ/YjbR family DNA-binding protein [Acidimicrobiales bacterium]
MDRSHLRAFCAAFPGAAEEFPFGDGVAVFKVGGRMFALVSLDGQTGRVHLKCDPELGETLRAQYAAVEPGYHLNKRHWNTVSLDGTVPDADVRWMIEHSYDRVRSGLPRRAQAALELAARG